MLHTTKSTKNTKCCFDSSYVEIRVRSAEAECGLSLGSISLTSLILRLFVVFVCFVVNHPGQFPVLE